MPNHWQWRGVWVWGAAGYRDMDMDNQRVLCHGLGRRGQAKRERGGKESKGRQGEQGKAREGNRGRVLKGQPYLFRLLIQVHDGATLDGLSLRVPLAARSRRCTQHFLVKSVTQAPHTTGTCSMDLPLHLQWWHAAWIYPSTYSGDMQHGSTPPPTVGLKVYKTLLLRLTRQVKTCFHSTQCPGSNNLTTAQNILQIPQLCLIPKKLTPAQTVPKFPENRLLHKLCRISKQLNSVPSVPSITPL